MWPIDQLRKRRYDRRYKAALVVFLGAHVSLDSAEEARVNREMTENLSRSDNPAAAWKRWASWDVNAAFRAAAMERAGIAPPIRGLSWTDLFAPWAHWRRWPTWPMTGFDILPTQLVLEFLPMDRATNDAKIFLRENGLTIPEADPQGRANVAV